MIRKIIPGQYLPKKNFLCRAMTSISARQEIPSFFAAGVLLLSVIIVCFTVPAGYEYLWIDLTIYGLFIAGFVALGFWTKKRPYYAIICALILYGLLIALTAYVDISSIFKAIIFKIIIIVYLIKGLSDAKEAQYMQDQIVE